MVVWLALGPHYGWSDTYQLVCNSATTVVTFLMVFLLQNSQSRDTAAIHVKLDELIRATNDARNYIIAAETLTDSEIEKLRTQVVADSSPGRVKRYKPST
jgi:low affinity Fe/Cu permease